MPLLIPLIALGVGAVGGFAMSSGVSKITTLGLLAAGVYFVVTK